MKPALLALPLAALAAALVGGGCGDSKGASNSGGATATTTGASSGGKGGGKPSGVIAIDGSSTVAPISEAITEAWGEGNPGLKFTVGVSGTGGGFKKFSAGELDIAGASRPIEAKEAEACKRNGVEFLELPIAYDGISIVANKDNAFLNDIKPEELKRIWQKGSTVKTWADVRPGLPAEPIKLYGPGTDNGTYDYFTEAICGKKGDSRTDYQASAQPNSLVGGIAGDKNSLAYFGYAYYDQNKDKLKLIKVNGVEPKAETILSGTYTPLSRPLFWYVRKSSLDRPEVASLVKFILANGKEAIQSTGYVVLPDAAYASGQKILDGKIAGTRFKEGETGLKIEDVLAREAK